MSVDVFVRLVEIRCLHCSCQLLKYNSPFVFVRIPGIGSMGQLQLDSSIRELKYLASGTIFSSSPQMKKKI